MRSRPPRRLTYGEQRRATRARRLRPCKRRDRPSVRPLHVRWLRAVPDVVLSPPRLQPKEPASLSRHDCRRSISRSVYELQPPRRRSQVVTRWRSKLVQSPIGRVGQRSTEDAGPGLGSLPPADRTAFVRCLGDVPPGRSSECGVSNGRIARRGRTCGRRTKATNTARFDAKTSCVQSRSQEQRVGALAATTRTYWTMSLNDHWTEG